MTEKFRVFMFHSNDVNQEETLEPVNIEEAVSKAKRLLTSLPCQAGTITRVIITDSDDSIVFEWIYGKGIVFPPKS